MPSACLLPTAQFYIKSIVLTIYVQHLAVRRVHLVKLL